jgi:hypothetical protein
MTPTSATRALLVVMIAVAGVGALDAGRAGSWDQVVIFTALLVGLAALLVRTSLRRPLVPIRADLVRWMGRRAAVSGEGVGAVADRAVAAYRSGLTGEECDHRGDDAA